MDLSKSGTKKNKNRVLRGTPKQELAHKSVTTKAVSTQEAQRANHAKQHSAEQKNDASLEAKPMIRAQSMLQGEKLTNALYLPVNSQDEHTVWDHVMKTFKNMAQHDYSQDSDNFDAYSMQYFMNTYFLARTRLCRIQEHDQDEGKLHLELNKLEGHSFTFYDQYQQRLSDCLAQMGKETEQKPKVEAEEEQKTDPFDFLDLSEQSSEAIIDGWLNDLKTDDDLQYDANRVFGALSSLAWNCKNEANKQKLMEHANTIVERSIAILRHLNSNQAVAYFASVCVLHFTGEVFANCTWEDVGVLCDVLKEWVKTKEEVEKDAEVKKVNKLLVREISHSREIVKACISVLLKLEGAEITGSQSRRVKQKLKVFDTTEKFQFADISMENLEVVRKILKLA